jgi:hypothetical protein
MQYAQEIWRGCFYALGYCSSSRRLYSSHVLNYTNCYRVLPNGYIRYFLHLSVCETPDGYCVLLARHKGNHQHARG